MLGFESDWLLWIRGVRADVLAIVGFVIACAVTVHVLLTKRDVGAAIGWIGLSWLSPIFGGIFYFMFGVNRVKRRALSLREEQQGTPARPPIPPNEGREDQFEPLEHAARLLTHRSIEAGNDVRVLHSGDAAYPEMLAAIEQASKSVALSSYILRDDAAGGPMIDALIAARARGAEVRVLIDGIGSGYFHSPAYRRLRANGVPCGLFMHSLLPWRMPFLNLRTHKKILVVDGSLGFTGGMNIGAENMLSTKPRHPVRDTHFRVRGPVVAQLMSAFASDWTFVTNEPVDGPIWFPPLHAAGEAMARVVTSGPDQDVEKIELIVLQAIGCARRSVRVMTPYFLPDERLITALALAAMRGVAVDVVVPAASNHRYVDWATHANIGPMLAEGARIWLGPPPFDHSKLMVVDGEWCLIGSANWDMRSFRLNFELCMEVYHCDLADTLEGMMAARRTERLTEQDIAARPLPVRLRDAGVRLMLPYL